MGAASPHYLMISVNAGFASHLLHDDLMAEASFREVVEQLPRNGVARGNLIGFLIKKNRFDDAERELDSLEEINFLGLQNERIELLRSRLSRAKRAIPPETEASMRQP